jgi:hypothetical protein
LFTPAPRDMGVPKRQEMYFKHIVSGANYSSTSKQDPIETERRPK